MNDEGGPSNPKKVKLERCMDWLNRQNSDTKKRSLQNKNDIQFIIQTNADRKNFLLSVAEDEATVPTGINEPAVEPKVVPLHRLRVDNLRIECEWQSCQSFCGDYGEFQKHVRTHITDIQEVIEKDDTVQYTCLWDICGHKTPDFNQIVRHINYHAYHAKLLAIGFNGRATLNLARCRKDSSKRNQLPKLPSDHYCMWTGCEDKFNSIQAFLDHMKLHVNYSDNHLCSWAGCGATFARRVVLEAHVRSHTGEKLIACYHCGTHFIGNRKLCDHSRRQNVYPNSPYTCSVCGTACATEYLLNEHVRQHVSAYVCALCDMSAPTPAALAHHARYRHMAPRDARTHACPHCAYKAVTKCDLRKHIIRHEKRKKKEEKAKRQNDSDFSDSDEDTKKYKTTRKYACHMCPDKQMKIFSRGSRLTTHLVKAHGAQWPFGHSRFRYQISEDGMYRLTTTRYEVLEVSKKIVDRDSGPIQSLTKNKYEFKLRQIAEPTENTPRRFEITVKTGSDDETVVEEQRENAVEITMCDVDEQGNIIKSEVFNSVVK